MFKVLVVEDEMYERQALCLMLRYNLPEIESIVETNNGLEAVELSRTHDFNLIFMDITLPGLDGLTAIKRIKEILPNADFIITSAHDSFSFVKNALHMGVKEYLLKPINIIELKNCISGIYRKHARSEEGKGGEDPFLLVLENGCFADGTLKTDVLKAYLSYRNFQLLSGFALSIKGELPGPQVLETIRRWERTEHFISVSTNSDATLTLFLMFQRPITLSDQKAVVQEIAQESLFLEANIGVGVIVSTAESAPDSIDSANLATITEDKHGIVFFSDISKEYGTIVLEEFIDDTVSSIKENTLMKIKESVHRFLCELERKSPIRSVFQKTLYSYYMRIFSEFSEDFEPPAMSVKAILGINVRSDIPELRDVIISDFLDIAQNLRFSQRGEKNRLIQSITDYLEDHYQTNIPLNDIAMKFNVSSFYLCRLIKKYLGKSFIEYLTELRIEKAKELLIGGSMTIKQIAFEVGFNSQAYFAKVFRMYTGISPTEFNDTKRKEIP